MRAIIDDGIIASFRVLSVVAREVAMEQMSKSGIAVQKSMRKALSSNGSNYITRVGANGPYLEKVVGGRQYGLRESHTQDNVDSNPPSMGSMLTSFLMEKSQTLVVGGMNPRFRPLLRKNGKVVGLGSAVPAVGARTAAILHRMDTGEQLADYPIRSMLTPDAEPRGFMLKGIRNASGNVRAYLSSGFSEASSKAVNKAEVKIIRKVIGE